MFRLTAPSEEDVRRFLSAQEQCTFSYREVGASAGTPPGGYRVDYTIVQLGAGKVVWEKAKLALRSWQIFQIPWLNLYWPDVAIEAGATVALCVRHWGFYSLNACRIVYVVTDEGPMCRFGFAYGTLADHAERGEERFTVEWRRDDSVWYSILAFSRPNQILSTIGYPLSRMLQRRFAEDSRRRCSVESSHEPRENWSMSAVEMLPVSVG